MKRWLLATATGVALGLPTALPSDRRAAAPLPAAVSWAGPATCLHNCRLDDDGLAFIQSQEGFSMVPYRDGAGLWTVGTGHRILPGERITYPLVGQDAADLLRKDVATSERGIARFVNIPLEQHEFTPVCSLTFNAGVGAIGDSTLVRVLNTGDKPGAATHFIDWNKVTLGGRKVPDKGLTLRRRREQSLFLFGE